MRRQSTVPLRLSHHEDTVGRASWRPLVMQFEAGTRQSMKEVGNEGPLSMLELPCPGAERLWTRCFTSLL